MTDCHCHILSVHYSHINNTTLVNITNKLYNVFDNINVTN